MKVEDGLEEIRWIRGPGGEKLPAASYALLPKPEKRPVFCHRRGIEIFVASFLHSSARKCLYQTPGRRPPHMTDRVVNTVTRGWVGAPNERAPFGFHDAVVGFVDRCLSRTRNLAAWNLDIWLSFSQADLKPNIRAGFFFSFFFFESSELFL